MFNLSKVVHEVLTFDEDFQTVFKTSILIAMQISTFKIEIPSQIVKTFSQICIFDEKKIGLLFIMFHSDLSKILGSILSSKGELTKFEFVKFEIG